MGHPEAPTEVVIDEYVEIAKSFFEGPEPAFVNAALDGVARDERAA
jgi:N utilization substance protein B